MTLADLIAHQLFWWLLMAGLYASAGSR